MLRRAGVLTAVVVVVAAGPVAAQGAGIGGRVGTLGLGVEVALDLTQRWVVRGGFGVAPLEPSATFDGIQVEVTLPRMYNVGVDYYLNGAFRIGGGVLFKRDDLRLSGSYTTAQDIGGVPTTPAELGTLTGVLDTEPRAPYALIGFGRHTALGAGLFIDVGVAFMGRADVQLGAEGGTMSDQAEPLRSRLDQEAVDFEADMGRHFEFWPIVSFGFRVGLG